MQKLFSHQFSRNIWRILPDQDNESNLWAIELRSGQNKEVSFAVIDTGRSEVLWEASVVGADWFSSMTAFSYKHLFLHNYRHSDIPEPTDLLMIDSGNGELQWALPNHVLVRTIDQDKIEVATRFGDKYKYLQCKAETGLVVSDRETDGESEHRQIILAEPVRYMVGNDYFDQLASFISRVTDGHVPVAIDYLDKRPYMMFSYYLYEQDKISEYLLIMTDQMEQLLHERLSEGREGIGRSTVLLKGRNLVYLKNNNEFKSLTL
ncbi:DUF4905 domain-containing protein [Dyadobacter luteus]|uniref:DUF4905 domain-containing protein n=1 Tax=Dyadobacter luteus TaxID=2259619 RepID=UPI0013146ACA|nr:DUF4905 domain-containing protein [Dyadobacter luteus]